ncbi:hypothetical protein [Deinococcus apachensis]|uniref:hypothetical protein n=1 Tax=Deinococcus apachensis TaxID=309886 RepID=UPI00036BA3DA|nr:hypothetical protein [Deinococcus apachensis]
MTATLTAPSGVQTDHLARALGGLDAWLEGMRGPDGYGGPVMHWWESNFLYTGALYDWRYEGVIDGYRELFLRTGQPGFLDRAIRAADELLGQQLPDGRWRRSSFQFGPVAGGTPHEAGLDSALLGLARTLRDLGRDGERYVRAARANIEGYWIGQLWNGRGFQDQPYNPVLVANKHATLLEALATCEALTGADFTEYIERCAAVVLGAQMQGGPQRGGTVHLGIGPSRLAIPIYTGRSMNGLLAYFDRTRDPRVTAALGQAAEFLGRLITPEGVLWGIYGEGRTARNPLMVAGAGDVLRFLLRVRERDLAPVEQGVGTLTALLLGAQTPGGGLPTARGFAAKGLSHSTSRVDLRDVLPVVGWVDKAFRALALALPPGGRVPTVPVQSYGLEVTWRGRRCTFEETLESLRVLGARGRLRYHWAKGEPSPRVYDL